MKITGTLGNASVELHTMFSQCFALASLWVGAFAITWTEMTGHSRS